MNVQIFGLCRSLKKDFFYVHTKLSHFFLLYLSNFILLLLLLLYKQVTLASELPQI